MSALREVFARFTTDFDDAGIVKGESAVEGFVGKLQALGGILAGGFVGRAVVGFAHQMADLAGELDAQSSQIGVSARDWQAWTHGAAQVGVAGHGVEMMFAELTKRATEAAHGNKGFAKAFREVGVAVKDAHGHVRPMQDVMLDLMDSFEGMPNQSERVTHAMTILGADGRKLIPILQQGRGAFEALRGEVDALGGGLSDELIARSGEATAATARFNMALLGLRSRLAVMVMPALTRATDGLARIVAGMAEVAGKTKILEASAVVAGVAAAAMSVKWLAAFGPMALKVGIVAAGVAILVLVVEDLMTALDGGDSLMGRFADATSDFFDQMRGQKGIVADIAREWEGYVETLERGIALLSDWLGIGPSVEDMYGERTTTQRGLVAPGQGVTAAQDAAAARDRASGGIGSRLARQGAALAQYESGVLANRPDGPRWDDEGLTRTTTQRGLQPPPVQMTVNLDVTAQGTDARQVAREAAREVRRELEAAQREAVDFLGQGVE